MIDLLSAFWALSQVSAPSSENILSQHSGWLSWVLRGWKPASR